jgi:hypothetical protein
MNTSAIQSFLNFNKIVVLLCLQTESKQSTTCLTLALNPEAATLVTFSTVRYPNPEDHTPNISHPPEHDIVYQTQALHSME